MHVTQREGFSPIPTSPTFMLKLTHVHSTRHQSQSWVAFAQRSVSQSSDCVIHWTNINVTQTVKKSAKVIIERYYPRLTLDFETNKRVCDEIAIIASKRLRNKVR